MGAEPCPSKWFLPKSMPRPGLFCKAWSTKDVATLDMVPEPVFTNVDEGVGFGNL